MGDTKPWNRLAAEVYAFFGRNPKSNRMVVEIAGLVGDDRLLDVGCGPGAAVRNAAGIVATATGVDPSPSMVAIAERRTRDSAASFRVGSAEDLPFDDGSFTVVWSVHAFHHWSDGTKGLEEIGRVLAPGGRVLIVERDAKRHGLTKVDAEELCHQLAELGFTNPSFHTRDKQNIVTAGRG